MIKYTAFAGLLLTAASLSQAATLYVDAVNGLDANDCISKSTACATPWEAYAKATAGDEILIAKGVYNQPVNGCQQWLRKAVAFKGGYDNTFNELARSGKAEDTAFKVAQVENGQPNATCRLFVITTGNSDWTVFDTLTIEGAGQNNGDSHSGLLHLFTNSEVTGSWLRLNNVIMRDNSMKGGNGAVNVVDGTGNKIEITNSLFQNNTASTNGGALAILADTEVTINNSSFITNNSQASGSAIYLTAGTATIKNSTFSGNIASGASSNGAIAVNGATVSMEYNTVANNTGDMSGGLFVESTPEISLKGNLLLDNKNSSNAEANVQVAINSAAFNDKGYNLLGASSTPGLLDNSGNTLVLNSYFDHQDQAANNTSKEISQTVTEVIQPVAYYGGPSTALTHKLLSTSEAKDYIPNESVPYYGVGTSTQNPFISLKQARATVGLNEDQYQAGKTFYFDLDGSYNATNDYNAGNNGNVVFTAQVDANGWVQTSAVNPGDYDVVEAEARGAGNVPWRRARESFCASFGAEDGRGLPRSDKTKPGDGFSLCDVGAFEYNNYYRQDCVDEDGGRPSNSFTNAELSLCFDPREGFSVNEIVENLGSFHWYWSAFFLLFFAIREKNPK